MERCLNSNASEWRVSLSSSPPVSDWDQPLTEQQLEAIEAIESTYQSVTKKRHSDSTPDRSENGVSQGPPNSGRRLPGSILSLRLPSSSTLSSCQENLKMKFPAMKFGGRIIYSRTATEVHRAASELFKTIEAIRKQKGRVSLGFDIEWKPTFRRGVPPGKAAVMQLCLQTSHCHVMHIIHSGIPQSLQFLLEDSTVQKVGVGIDNDAVKVLKDYNVSIKALEELSCLANQKLAGGPQKWSLKYLAEILISKELPKPNKIRLGNWEADFLSKEQLQYAATDAFASWYLYEVLKELPDAQKVEDERNYEVEVVSPH